MSEHLTDEEQLEALKRWWDENGRALMFGVILAVGGYFGWQAWGAQQQTQAEAAAVLYQDMTEAMSVPQGETLNETKRATALHLADQLKTEHGASLYAQNAALFSAKIALENGELDTAAAELQWALDQNPSDAIAQVARLRLARVLSAQQSYEQALAQLNDESESFRSAYAQVRGDIYLAQNKVSEARAAYQLALDSVTAEQSNSRNLLEIKLNNLQLPSVAESTPSVEASAETSEDAETTIKTTEEEGV